MTTISSLNPSVKPTVTAIDRLLYRLSQKWLLVFSLIFGLYVGLPFLAPVFMQVGWVWLAKTIYLVYSFLCHQLPQRSLFLFGSQGMYSLSEIQAAGQNVSDFIALRQFIGTPEIGWKVAWSDRMISMYTSILIFAWLWWLLRRRLRTLPWWGLIFLMLPMAVDGTTHLISDLRGFGQGFRYTNNWLATLTNNAFPTTFYVGNVLGSFNSWMRWVSGILFGVGVVWFGFPYLDEIFAEIATSIKTKFRNTELEP